MYFALKIAFTIKVVEIQAAQEEESKGLHIQVHFLPLKELQVLLKGTYYENSLVHSYDITREKKILLPIVLSLYFRCAETLFSLFPSFQINCLTYLRYPEDVT